MVMAPRILPQVQISGDGTGTQSQRLQDQSSAKALIKVSSLDGSNASPALDGRHGKPVNVELIPSAKGGFDAKGTIGKVSSITHVAAGLDLFVSSKGSDGEDGGRGGDGRPGEDGIDGKNATAHSDATRGQNGGMGGDGGLGSSGGNGGNGGEVRVSTNEDNMHLVLAVDWDVRGGKGGNVGRHGQPGRGGYGGRGGSEYSWNEETGHEWKCVQHDTTSVVPSRTGNANELSLLKNGRDLEFYFPQGYVSDGAHVAQLSNLQGKIPAHMAPQFQRAIAGPSSMENMSNAITTTRTLAANSLHAPGCRQVPTYIKRYKPGAPDGRQGPSGRTPTARLTPGRDGSDGNAVIVVNCYDGSVSRYDSKFEFQLSEFEVEDENGDGIFEPGECVIIKNIRVKNLGGMPTPKKTLIPVRMQPTSDLEPIHGKDVVYLPLDIPPGGTKRITNSIWARIKPPNRSHVDRTPYKAVSTIRIEAVVPDLNRKLPCFEFSQNVTVQYPVTLVTDECKWLDTVPQGSSTSLQWAVMNVSSKDLGRNSQSQRHVVTKLSCPSTAPAILGKTQSHDQNPTRTSSRHELCHLHRDMSCQILESLHILKDAVEYSTMEFLIELFLTPASAGKSLKSPEMVLLQTFHITMQVSRMWQFSPDSDFLLLTSKSTTKETIDSWSRFISKHLYMSTDVWNISLYGGLEAEETCNSVLDQYNGKTILALDDDLFQYFDQGQRSILDFIDPLEGSALSRKGTKVVSVQRQTDARLAREAKNIERVAHAAALRNSHLAASEFHQFERTDELVTWLHQLQANPSTSKPYEQYFIPFHGPSSSGKDRKIAKRLRKEFPLERFIVSDSADGLGVRIFHCGVHGQGYSTAQVAQTSNGVGRIEEFSGLNPAEAYSCVSALPLKTRLDFLDASRKAGGVSRYSDFVNNAALNSVKAELHDQVQAMSKHSRWRHSFKASDDISTKTLFDSANDKITITLEHDIMLEAGASIEDPLSPAGQILRSIVQSARCQTTEQLLVKWLSPFKRTRSHVKRNLMGMVQNVIESSGSVGDSDPKAGEQRIKSFKRSVGQKLLRKNHQAIINSDVQEITHDAIRDVKQSLTTIEEIMPKSTYKSPNELSKEQSSYEEAEMKRFRDQVQHREWKEELGMEVSESTPAESDAAAELAETSKTDSSELASVSAFDDSLLSATSEAFTTITVPDTDDGHFFKAGISHKLEVANKERETLPLTPQSVDRIPYTQKPKNATQKINLQHGMKSDKTKLGGIPLSPRSVSCPSNVPDPSKNKSRMENRAHSENSKLGPRPVKPRSVSSSATVVESSKNASGKVRLQDPPVESVESKALPPTSDSLLGTARITESGGNPGEVEYIEGPYNEVGLMPVTPRSIHGIPDVQGISTETDEIAAWCDELEPLPLTPQSMEDNINGLDFGPNGSEIGKSKDINTESSDLHFGPLTPHSPGHLFDFPTSEVNINQALDELDEIPPWTDELLSQSPALPKTISETEAVHSDIGDGPLEWCNDDDLHIDWSVADTNLATA